MESPLCMLFQVAYIQRQDGHKRKMGKTTKQSPYAEDRKPFYPCLCCILTVASLVTIIVVSLCFSGLEYNEVGLQYQRSTSKVNREQVHHAGQHFVGPDYSFRRFEISVQRMRLKDMSAWTRNDGDVSAGASIFIDCSILYRLRAQDVGKLYSLVGLHYRTLTRTRVIEAIKNVAPQFTLNDYLQHRDVIEATFSQACAVALDTVFADLYGFQLLTVTLPDEVMYQKLASATQAETNDRESYLQEVSVIQAQTAYDVQVIQNQADFIRENAKAQARLIESEAEATALQIVEDTRKTGLADLYQGLDITQQKHKAALHYLLTLMQHNATNLFVDFSDASAWTSIP